MYEQFFGLERRPFSLAPDPEFLFWTRQHRLGATILELGIERQSPITLVTGRVGTGKTTLIRQFLRTSPRTLSIGLLSNFLGDHDELYGWILMAFGQDHSGREQPILLGRLQHFFLAEYSAGRRAVLIVDEAQSLSEKGVELLRLLTNINVAKEVVATLVLVGQPELRERLKRPEYRQIVQRIGAHFDLPAMSAEDTRGYVAHRLEVAGGSAALFAPEAVDLLHGVAGGIPRVVNTLGDMCLAAGFGAGAATIDAALAAGVIDAARASGSLAVTPAAEPERVAGILPDPRLRRPRRGSRDGDGSRDVVVPLVPRFGRAGLAVARLAGGEAVARLQDDPAVPMSLPQPGSGEAAAAPLTSPAPAPARPAAADAGSAAERSDDEAGHFHFRMDRPAGAAAPQRPAEGGHLPAAAPPAAVPGSRGAAGSGAPEAGRGRPPSGAAAARRVPDAAAPAAVPLHGSTVPGAGSARPGVPGRVAGMPGLALTGGLVLAAGIAAALLLRDDPAAPRAAVDVPSAPAGGAPVRSAPGPQEGAGRTTLPSAAEPPPASTLGVAEPAREAGGANAPVALPPGLSAASPAELYHAALAVAAEDPRSAATAFSRAAARGHARSAYFLGQMYESGDGVPVNITLARAWYAASGGERAASRLADLAAPEASSAAPGRPVLLAAEAAPEGVDLVWTSAPGADPADFRVELAEAPGGPPLHAADAAVSALHLAPPAAARVWRVVASDAQGRSAASDWALLPSQD